ncbi:hypothetical protein C8J57DRAFT_1323405, partial [Mycena rebaudengoi]
FAYMARSVPATQRSCVSSASAHHAHHSRLLHKLHRTLVLSQLALRSATAISALSFLPCSYVSIRDFPRCATPPRLRFVLRAHMPLVRRLSCRLSVVVLLACRPSYLAPRSYTASCTSRVPPLMPSFLAVFAQHPAGRAFFRAPGRCQIAYPAEYMCR